MTVNYLYHIFSYVSVASTFIPLACCILKFKTLNLSLRVLFLYLVIAALAEVISIVLSLCYIENYIVQHSFTLIEFFLLSFLFYLAFSSRLARGILIAISLIFFITAAYTLLYLEHYKKSDNILSPMEALIMMTLALCFFCKVMLELTIPKLQDYYFFWIAAAVLLYFAPSFMLFLFDGYLEKSGGNTFYALYSLHLFSNIVYNVLLTIGILKFRPGAAPEHSTAS